MLHSRTTTAQFILQLAVSAVAVLASGWVVAQPSVTASTKPTPSLPGRPLWMDLTESQQQALAPLAQQWPTMTEPHKRKWLAISQSFAQLSPEEQATVQGRMRAWAALSPQQRTAARLNYADAQQLLQEDKKAKWEAYQALSPQAKQKLAAQQGQPVLGAAPATKPVPPTKLATPPAANPNKALPRIASDQAAPATLLPTPMSNSAPASGAAADAIAPPQ